MKSRSSQQRPQAGISKSITLNSKHGVLHSHEQVTLISCNCCHASESACTCQSKQTTTLTIIYTCWSTCSVLQENTPWLELAWDVSHVVVVKVVVVAVVVVIVVVIVVVVVVVAAVVVVVVVIVVVVIVVVVIVVVVIVLVLVLIVVVIIVVTVVVVVEVVVVVVVVVGIELRLVVVCRRRATPDSRRRATQ